MLLLHVYMCICMFVLIGICFILHMIDTPIYTYMLVIWIEGLVAAQDGKARCPRPRPHGQVRGREAWHGI